MTNWNEIVTADRLATLSYGLGALWLALRWDTIAADWRKWGAERRERAASREAWLKREYDDKGLDRPWPHRR